MSACETCGFDLWVPLARRGQLAVGLYNDALFPGRCILSLDNHYEHLHQLPPSEMFRFAKAQQDVSRAIRVVMQADRINVSVLGNTESHVHAHIIPRFADEPNPTRTPWEHPDYTGRGKLSEHELDRIRGLLVMELQRQRAGWRPLS